MTDLPVIFHVPRDVLDDIAVVKAEELTAPEGFVAVDLDEQELIVEINGRAKSLAPAPCRHNVLFEQVVHGVVRENPDGTGPIVGHQALLKGRCGECGASAVFDAVTARQSETVGERGVVVEFHFDE